MKQLLFSSILFLTLVVCPSCDPMLAELYLTNNAEHAISTYVADGWCSGFSYPTTTLPSKSNLNEYCLTESILGNACIFAKDIWNKKDFLNSTQQGILSIYIFDQRIVDAEGWDSVLANNEYIVRYDLTQRDLDALHFQLFYPPSESMRDIQMFPPYEEIK